jgi:hypothetical protein
VAALAVFASVSLQAGTFQVPKEEPIASITFPEKWKAEADDTSLEVLSPDEDIYINIETHDGAKLAEAVAAAIATLKEHKVTIDQASQKKTEAKHNGLSVVNVDWDGTSEDGKVKVSLTVLTQDEKRALLMIYVATPDAEKKHEQELGTIQQSIKAVAK